MSVESFIDSSEYIYNAEKNLYGPRFNAERYEHFNKGPLLNIRKYLNEKKQMGLVNEVEIMGTTMGNYYRFCIYNVNPKIWTNVFFPSILIYASHSQFQFYPEDEKTSFVNVYLWVQL